MMTDEYLEKLNSTDILGDSDFVKFCEEHECENCPAFYRVDKRSTYEKTVLQVPCCVNLTRRDIENAK